MKKYQLGFIGCGNMAQAIIRSLLSPVAKDAFKGGGIRLTVAASDLDAEKVAAVDAVYYADKQDLCRESDILFLAVKPQAAEAALAGLDFMGKPVFSIMAGVNIAQLKALTGSNKVVRIMPNLNARIANSYNAYCAEGLSDDEAALIPYILGAFGEYACVEEKQMNAITGVTGSGPAFVFMFIQAFCTAAERQGFDAATAKRMALATVIGSAYNIEASEDAINDMVDAVCSKGGTTIQGVDYLRNAQFEDTVVEAIERAIRRAAEMESER